MSNPVILHNDTHRKLRVITTRGAEFGEKTHIVPVLGDELHNLVLDFPVYLMKDKDGLVVYVGKAKNLSRRVTSYFNRSFEIDAKLERVRDLLWDIDIVLCGSECEALLLEHELIREYRPSINSQVRVHGRSGRHHVFEQSPGLVETAFVHQGHS